MAIPNTDKVVDVFDKDYVLDQSIKDNPIISLGMKLT